MGSLDLVCAPRDIIMEFTPEGNCARLPIVLPGLGREGIFSMAGLVQRRANLDQECR